MTKFKTFAFTLSFLAGLPFLTPPALAEDGVSDGKTTTQPIMKTVFAVLEGPSNQSIENEKANLGNQLRNGVETLLRNHSAPYIDRANLDKTLREIQLQQSGLVSKDTSLELGQFIGANTGIYCSIEEIRVDSSDFSGYDTEYSTTSYTAVIFVKVVDLKTQIVQYAQAIEGEPEISLKSQYGSNRSKSMEEKALNKAIEKLGSDTQFVKLLKAAS